MLTVSPARATTVRRRRGSSLTRQHILTAAIHLFSRRGFSCTTVRDIARQAGITDAAIYYHFATKEELLREILYTRLRSDDWTAQRPLSADIRESVDESVHKAAQAIEENQEVLRIIVREGLAGNPDAACRYGQLLNDWESRMGGRLLRFESTGSLAYGEADSLARQIIYTIIMAFEDMLLLRPDASASPAKRRRQALVFLSRHIDSLIPNSCDILAHPCTAGRSDRLAQESSL
jgi:AcrR family transcriptional regulator